MKTQTKPSAAALRAAKRVIDGRVDPGLQNPVLETVVANIIEGELSPLREALEAAVTQLESWYVDWERLSRESPDYDPDYKPEFPESVKELRKATTQ
jgi:hypothetical protein